MKTTLNISDTVMRALKEEAARQGRTMSEMVEAALRALLQHRAQGTDLPPLPEFSGGGTRVSVSDREALYDVMDG